MKVDAIVNPSNPRLQHIAGLGQQIVKEGGKVIQNESSAIGFAPVGSAVVTTGGNLLCKFVIHAIAPRMGDGDEDAKLRSATRSSLQRAEELAIASIAMPAMSTGVFGFPFERCARVMLGATVDFRREARSLRNVVYCLFGEESFASFERVLNELEAVSA